MSRCPLCASPSLGDYHADARVRLVRCRDCGVKFQSPMPSAEDLAALYSSSDYYEHYYPEAALAARRRLFDYRLGRLEALPGVVRGDVLDIGCGRGQFLEAALARGWRAFGLEFSEQAADLAGRGVQAEVRYGPFPDAPLYEGQGFDLIHLNHVLEHFHDPAAALRVVFGLLRPGGVLYCEVPRQSNLQNRLSSLLGKKDLAVSYLPEHLFYFDTPSLSRLLIKTGFTDPTLRVEGMGDPCRYERGVHYTSAWTHLIVAIVGTFRLQGPLGGGNLVAVARKPPSGSRP